MEPKFWIDLWKANEAPWHQGEPDPLLVKYFPKRAQMRVLVPLCGKSIDMLWLQRQGHFVMGIELSEEASCAFFDEAKLNYDLSTRQNFKVMSSGNIRIFCGDFFETTPELLGTVDYIYDRAAIIALPAELRLRYAKKIIELSEASPSKNVEGLTIVRDKRESGSEGPPFFVSADELQQHYGAVFKIESLESLERSSSSTSRIVDTAYRLKWRS